MTTPQPPPPGPAPQEKTFSAYNASQGQKYAEVRPDYHPKVYHTILDHHTSTGGHLDTLLDIGCGPGNATRSLAPHFTNAIGLDPSEGMIATARSLTSADNIHFDRSMAEQLGSNLTPPVGDGSIDLITAANAAHWFDMSGFWPAAARVLKPGGTVALWTSGAGRTHPSVPNSAAIQAAMDEHQETHMAPFMERGNILTRNRYVDIVLPWTLSQRVHEFDPDTFLRFEWPIDEPFFVGVGDNDDDAGADLDTFEEIVATGSAETRWRQAHPDLVGTEGDVLKQLRFEVERLLHEAGVKPGEERLRGVVEGVLLFVKKKAV
ncbi:hypothetical protein LTR67_007591 [Exophiala xenobiotica]